MTAILDEAPWRAGPDPNGEAEDRAIFQDGANGPEILIGGISEDLADYIVGMDKIRARWEGDYNRLRAALLRIYRGEDATAEERAAWIAPEGETGLVPPAARVIAGFTIGGK